MKVVVVKFDHNPPLTPLVVSDAATLAAVLQQWRQATGVVDARIRLRTVAGTILNLEADKVSDLPWIDGYSSVEIIAERFLTIAVSVGGRQDAKLKLEMATTDTVADLKTCCRQVLECGAKREIVLRRARDEQQLEDELDEKLELGHLEGEEVEAELVFYVRIFPPAGERGAAEDLKVFGSQSLSTLLSSKDERLASKSSKTGFGKARRTVLAAFGPKAGECASAPEEVIRLRPLTVNFLSYEHGEARTETREVWPTALASSLLPDKRKDLLVWRNAQPVSSCTFASLSLSTHEFLLIDAALSLQLRGLCTQRLQLPVSCSVLQLRQRLEALLRVTVFDLYLPNGDPLGPESATLKALGPPAEVEVRAVKLKVQIAYEGNVLALRGPLEVGASSSRILEAAREVLEEELPADTLIACSTCGRSVLPGGEGLPLSCCSNRIRRLLLTRFLDVKLWDAGVTSHLKIPSTAVTADVVAEVALPMACRLLADGVPLAASQRVSSFAKHNRLVLRVERRFPLLLDLSAVGGARRVATVWPSDRVAALEVAGLATGERRLLREGGGEVAYEGGSLAEQHVDKGDVLSVVSGAEPGVPAGEAAFKVICYEWQVPNFDVVLSVPPSVEQLRAAVNARFSEVGAPLDGSRLVQLQAVTDSGELALCTASNVWVLTSGEKVPMRCLGQPFFRPLARVLPFAVGERVKIHLRGAL